MKFTESAEWKIDKICAGIMSITDEEFQEAEKIAQNQKDYNHPFNMATVRRMNKLGEYNEKVISALRDLRALIESGENI